jgi:hypothetical protein
VFGLRGKFGCRCEREGWGPPQFAPICYFLGVHGIRGETFAPPTFTPHVWHLRAKFGVNLPYLPHYPTIQTPQWYFYDLPRAWSVCVHRSTRWEGLRRHKLVMNSAATSAPCWLAEQWWLTGDGPPSKEMRSSGCDCQPGSAVDIHSAMAKIFHQLTCGLSGIYCFIILQVYVLQYVDRPASIHTQGDGLRVEFIRSDNFIYIYTHTLGVE